jgi:hypothetical protein
VRGGGGEEAGALGQQLDGLHGDDDEGEGGTELEERRVGGHGADVEPGGARRERRQQLRLAVQRGHGEARAREVERDAPGARADVEHRPALGRRELPPQRQVGVVAAALDVVPYHQRREAHRQCPVTWPRSDSRSRRASSAV